MNLTPQRLVATLALLAALAVSAVPAALADDWARDRAQATAYQLDPAIRTAIEARAPAPAVAQVASPSSPTSQEDGFAWGAAGIGMLVGIGAVCFALGCVTLVRHDGRLRSA